MNGTIEAPELVEQEQTHDEHVCQHTVWTEIFRQVIEQTPMCGRPATHQVMKTCCGGVSYVCDEHIPHEDPKVAGYRCNVCGHRCPTGVCWHRVVMPV